jgi:hypothetical protein
MNIDPVARAGPVAPARAVEGGAAPARQPRDALEALGLGGPPGRAPSEPWPADMPMAADFAAILETAAQRARHEQPGPGPRPELPEDAPGTEAIAALPPAGATAGAPADLPAPVARAHVDPSAFADMLAKLWVRDEERRTRDVRVRFGDAAWPATAARLERLGDGSLAIAIAVDGRHGAGPVDVEGLAARLAARGLAVQAVHIEDGASDGGA